MKRRVAHLNSAFFERSETFIYNFVSNHLEYDPICIATEAVRLDGFPLSGGKVYLAWARRFTLRWLHYAVLRRIKGDDAVRERIISKKKALILHAHFGPTGFGALGLKEKLNIPLVTSFYGYDASAMAKDASWREKYTELFEKGDLFLVEGPAMKSRLEGLGCPALKIRIQRIGIDLARVGFRVRVPKNRDEKAVILFAGRFVEKKGLLHALEAIRLLKEKTAGFELRLIGDGPLKGRVEGMIKEYALEREVCLLGFLGYAEYLAEMQKADIFLHPSVTAKDGDSEGGAPTTILEAQAMGIPVVSTMHADIPAVTAPGKSALLSPEGDPVSLAENLSKLVISRDMWQGMGMVGRGFVEERHDIKKEVRHLESLYGSLLGGL